MGFFTSKHSPTIVNMTKHSIVVFQERGFLYNKQVLAPGEAVSMTSAQTTGHVPLLPYHVHAVVGDARNAPTREQSVKNLVSVSVIPMAFIVAALATAASAGTLAGPSAALAPMVSGMVVKGVVIDSAALAAGAVAASRVTYISELLLKQQPTKFMAKSGRLMPGQRFVIVTGGLDDGNLVIESVSRRKFRRLNIQHFKEPADTIKDKIHYYVPVLKPSAQKKTAAAGDAQPFTGFPPPIENPVQLTEDDTAGRIDGPDDPLSVPNGEVTTTTATSVPAAAAASIPKQKPKRRRRWICCCWI